MAQLCNYEVTNLATILPVVEVVESSYHGQTELQPQHETSAVMSTISSHRLLGGFDTVAGMKSN